MQVFFLAFQIVFYKTFYEIISSKSTHVYSQPCLSSSLQGNVEHFDLSSCSVWCASIGGSVVECSPATRAARVRFPADATQFYSVIFQFYSPSPLVNHLYQDVYTHSITWLNKNTSFISQLLYFRPTNTDTVVPSKPFPVFQTQSEHF